MFRSKRRLWPVLAVALLVAAMMPGLAAVYAANAAREAPVTQADLIGPVWELTEVVQTNPDAQTVIPSPESYTLQFRAGGDLTVRADCNTVRATYILRGDLLLIETGPSTMAFCGEDSLDQQFLTLLGRVERSLLVDGELRLLLDSDAGYLSFRAATGLGINPEDIILDTQGLPFPWQANLMPVSPFDAGAQPGGAGLPAHIQINFGNINPAERQPADPVMYIIPVQPYQDLWSANGDDTVAQTVAAIFDTVVTPPESALDSGLPVLPREEVAGLQEMTVQLAPVQPAENSATANGYRFVSRFTESAAGGEPPLRYIYQGFTNDGQFLVSFFAPVTSAELDNTATAAEFDNLAAADWEPDLATLDALVASLQIDGMPAVGLHDTAWQLSAIQAEGDGQPTPVAAQENYTVAFHADGTLEYVADCNSGAGDFEADGGMAGSLQIELTRSTLALCEPGSLSDTFKEALAAAQEYRIHPGGQTLELPRSGDGALFFTLAGEPEEVATPTPVPTAVLPTPAPAEPTGRITAQAGVNVRLGPSTQFPILATVPFNTTGKIVGRSADGQWWVTEMSSSPTGLGWVSASFVEATNADNVPVLPAPPLPPTPTPLPPTPPPAPWLSFSAEPSRIERGQCATLHWNVGNVQAVWVYPQGSNYQSFPVAGVGSRTECPQNSQTWEMRVLHFSGAVDFRQATIEVTTPAQPIIEFSADPTNIRQGQCTTLRWRVENVDSVWVLPQGANYRDFPVVGVSSRQECPSTTTTYDIRVRLRDGSITRRSVTVEVTVSNPLANTNWTLLSMARNRMYVPDLAPITLSFDARDRVSGHAGCNNYNGIYTISGQTLLIGGVSSGFMMCEENINQIEQSYLQTLQATSSFRIENNELVLFDTSGGEILRFRR